MIHTQATAREPCGRLFAAVADRCLDTLSDLDPQGLANVAWAFATAHERHARLFDAIADACVARAAELRPRNVSGVLWAFATAAHVSPDLFATLSSRAARDARDFGPQALANTCWAVATAGEEAPALFRAVAARAVIKPHVAFKMQGVSLNNLSKLWRISGIYPDPVAGDRHGYRAGRRARAEKAPRVPDDRALVGDVGVPRGGRVGRF